MVFRSRRQPAAPRGGAAHATPGARDTVLRQRTRARHDVRRTARSPLEPRRGTELGCRGKTRRASNRTGGVTALALETALNHARISTRIPIPKWAGHASNRRGGLGVKRVRFLRAKSKARVRPARAGGPRRTPGTRAAGGGRSATAPAGCTLRPALRKSRNERSSEARDSPEK